MVINCVYMDWLRYQYYIISIFINIPTALLKYLQYYTYTFKIYEKRQNGLTLLNKWTN